MEVSQTPVNSQEENLINDKHLLTTPHKPKTNQDLNQLISEKKHQTASRDSCPKVSPNLIFCPICSKTFVEIRHLIEHLPLHQSLVAGQQSVADVDPKNSQSHSKEKLTCQICGECYRSELTFRRHLLHHSGVRPFKCDTCEKSFNLTIELNEHLKEHRKDELEEQSPGKNIRQISSVQQSRSEEQNAVLHIGDLSKTEANQLEKPPTALVSNRPEKSDVEKAKTHSNKVACPICSKVFNNNGCLTLHLRHHKRLRKSKQRTTETDNLTLDADECSRNTETLVCEVDPEVFASQENVTQQREKLSAGLSRPTEAEMLESEIQTSNIAENSLDESLDASDEREFPQWSNRPNLKRQVLNRKAKKSFSCLECGKSFAREYHLRRHLPVHFNKMQKDPAPQNHQGESTKNIDEKKVTECSSNTEGRAVEKRDTATNAFTCGNCQKTFVGKKPHACDNCRSEFPQPYSTDVSIANVEQRSKASYVCEICGKNFILKRKLTLHLQRHRKGKRFKCDACEKIFVSSQALNKHVARHSKEGTFSCGECGLNFSYEHDLARHRTGISLASLIHLADLKKKNSEIAADVPLREQSETAGGDKKTSASVDHQTLSKHPPTRDCDARQKEFNGEKPRACDNYLKELPEPSSSDVTAEDIPCETSKRSTSDTSSAFKCFFCFKAFSRINCLQVHVLCHSAEKVTCGVCGGNFTHISALYIHLRLHFKEKPFKCDQCGRSFVRKDRLERHLRVHSGEKPCLCEVCGKCFKSKRSHAVHIRVHGKRPLTSNRPFQCETCHEKFFTNFRLSNHRCAASSSREPRGKCACYVCGKELFEDSLKRHLLLHSGEKFKCNVCGKSFSRKYGLNSHLVVHSGEKPFLCEFCGDKFSTREMLRNHRLKHSDAKPFACEVCHKRFLTDFNLKNHRCETSSQKMRERCSCPVCGKEVLKNWLKNHVLSHSGEKPYKCDVCGRSFPCKLYLNKHLPIHSEEKPFPCEACGKKYSSKRQLCEHRRRHPDATTSVKNFACESCPKEFSSSFHLKNHRCKTASTKQRGSCHVCGKEMLRTHLKSHLLSHSGERPFKCEVCGKSFTRKLNLNYHLPIHSGERNFPCEVCGKKFASKKHLSDHSRHHSDKKYKKPEKNLTCEFCPKKFTDGSKLKEHLRTHSGERPFTCDICQKSFTQRGNLNTHRLHHEGVKAFLCEQCSKAFYTAGELNRHQQICNGERPFECEFCHKTFRSSSILCRHRRVHTGEKPFLCKVCGKGFRASTHLKRHTRIHTGERPYKCGVCQKEFTQQYNLKTHLRTHSRDATSSPAEAMPNHGTPTTSAQPNHPQDAPMSSGLPHRSHVSMPPSLPNPSYVRDASMLPSRADGCDASLIPGLPHCAQSLGASLSLLPNRARGMDGHVPPGLSNQQQLSGHQFPPQQTRPDWYY